MWEISTKTEFLVSIFEKKKLMDFQHGFILIFLIIKDDLYVDYNILDNTNKVTERIF